MSAFGLLLGYGPQLSPIACLEAGRAKLPQRKDRKTKGPTFETFTIIIFLNVHEEPLL